jgi:hypothetical protein
MNDAVSINWEQECKCLTEQLNCQKAEFTHRTQLLLDQIADRDRIITQLQDKLKISDAKLEMVELIFEK